MNIIGRKDKIDLPEFNLKGIDAKIDTGAYGSALHCHHVSVVLVDGRECLSFQLLDPTHPEYENIVYTTDHFSDKKVKSSSGIIEHRFTITTKMILFNKVYLMEFSLTDRNTMKYPVLLGRKFLRKKFLVDVTAKNLSYTKKN
jgi:hypothetical protein